MIEKSSNWRAMRLTFTYVGYELEAVCLETGLSLPHLLSLPSISRHLQLGGKNVQEESCRCCFNARHPDDVSGYKPCLDEKLLDDAQRN